MNTQATLIWPEKDAVLGYGGWWFVYDAGGYFVRRIGGNSKEFTHFMDTHPELRAAAKIALDFAIAKEGPR